MMFDESVMCRFYPAEKLFWETKELQKFLLFISHSSNSLGNNVLIADPIVFPQLNWTDEAAMSDILFASLSNNYNEMVSTNHFMSKILKTDPLPDDDLKYYDATLFMISDKLRPAMQDILTRICQESDIYITRPKANAILSIAATLIQKQKGATISTLDSEFVALDHASIKNFYSIT